MMHQAAPHLMCIERVINLLAGRCPSDFTTLGNTYHPSNRRTRYESDDDHSGNYFGEPCRMQQRAAFLWQAWELSVYVRYGGGTFSNESIVEQELGAKAYATARDHYDMVFGYAGFWSTVGHYDLSALGDEVMS